MKIFEEMTLEEMPEVFKKRYIEEINLMASNKLAKEIINRNYGKSLIDIYHILESSLVDYKSELFFPGEYMKLYCRIEERKTKTQISCDFSSGIIFPGSIYIPYRPLLKNIETNESYVLSPALKVDYYFATDLPQNIREFEELTYKMLAEKEDSSGIDYNHLNSVVGGDFTFQKLKSRRNR